MEVILDKRINIDAPVAQAWSVLSDVRAVAACMPGAAITEQLDDTHFRGTVRSKVGPATLSFGGEIELLGHDEQSHSIELMGRGADKAGSSASMKLAARIEAGEQGKSILVGHATVTVTGKLAQFGSRLLVPIADAMLAQFAENFAVAAKAVAPVAPAAAIGIAAHSEAPSASLSPPALLTAPKELNALALMWSIFRVWLRGLFRRAGS